jgi:aspartate kinase
MSLIVQKFGGTSVADSQKILAAARKAVRAQQQGHQVVVVVSAMGHNTDLLIDLAREINDDPPAREMDMLLSTGEQVSVALMAMAVEALGQPAISFTGAQIGIRTDSSHTRARIRTISTERMRKALDNGKIVVAAGFQGIDEELNITTLGRGGSDTTAVALAAVLGANECEIYTDVDGVYTTDPRILPEARQVMRISYDEMLELASLGAGVLHNRSVEFAKRFNVPLVVRSSFSDVSGTLVDAVPEADHQAVCGCALEKDEARISLLGVPDRPGVSLAVFTHLAKYAIPIDMIVQNVGTEGRANISFTVLRDDLPKTLKASRAIVEEVGAVDASFDEGVSKVSAVGLGMAEQPGVAAKMFRALADAGVNILMITTSEIKISALVARRDALTALRAIHVAFELDKPPAARTPFIEVHTTIEDLPDTISEHTPNEGAAMEVIKRLQGMEDLTVEDISSDDTQARITVEDMADTPGLAARLFEAIGAAGVLVDMIVQDVSRNRMATMSFTVPRKDLAKAEEVTRAMAKELGAGRVSVDPDIAKLSVMGIGLRSHTGVALRMFEALGKANVNLQLIFTSEVRVNVLVSRADGPRALKGLQEAFSDAIR